MTDKLLTVIKVGVVVLFLVALGMGGWLLYTKVFGGEEDGNGDGEEEKIQLVWWTLWEEENDLRVLADAYEAQNPNVTILIEVQEIESQYKDNLIDVISDGIPSNGPDIARIHNTWVPQLVNNLSPIPSSVMSAEEYKSSFYDTAYTDLSGGDGMIYAIPLMFDSIGVYYNETLLKNAGYTVPEENWDDFLAQARALTEYDEEGNIKVGGAGIGTAEKVDFSFDILSLLMLQEGATIVGTDGMTSFSQDTDQRAAKAIKFYTDFSTRHRVWDRTLDMDITMFAEGRLAMMFAPSWRVHDINNALDSAGATLDYDIAPVPQQPTVSGGEVNWATYWAEAVSAESENPEVAWDFLRFISQPEQLRSFYEKCKESRDFGEIYPRPDMADELVSEPYVGAYIKMADTARSWRMVDEERVAEEFDTLIKDIVVAGGMTTARIHTNLATTASVIDQILMSAE